MTSDELNGDVQTERGVLDPEPMSKEDGVAHLMKVDILQRVKKIK